MIKSKEQVIDGITFQTTQFPAFPALDMKVRLGQVFGPAVAKIMQSVKPEEVEEKITNSDIKSLLPGLETLIMGLKPGQFSTLCLDLMKHTTAIIGKGEAAEKVEITSEPAFNLVFSESLLTVYKVFWFVLGANGFFGFGGIGKALAKKMAAMTPATPASNPPPAP